MAALARAVMRQADRHLRNGRLTVNEMRTFLKGSEHQDFGEWLSAPRTRDHMWKRYDLDMDGGLDVHELEGLHPLPGG